MTALKNISGNQAWVKQEEANKGSLWFSFIYKQRKHLTVENLMGTYKLVPQMRRSGNHCGTDRNDDYRKFLRLVKVIYHLAKFVGNTKNIGILAVETVVVEM